MTAVCKVRGLALFELFKWPSCSLHCYSSESWRMQNYVQLPVLEHLLVSSCFFGDLGSLHACGLYSSSCFCLTVCLHCLCVLLVVLLVVLNLTINIWNI